MRKVKIGGWVVPTADEMRARSGVFAFNGPDCENDPRFKRKK